VGLVIAQWSHYLCCYNENRTKLKAYPDDFSKFIKSLEKQQKKKKITYEGRCLK